MGQHQIAVERACACKAVNTASAPHIGKSVRIKEVGISFHQAVGVLLKFFCEERLIFIAVPQIPERRIEIKCPAGIIVKTLPVAVPAIPHIIIKNGLRMVKHNFMVNRIAFHMQKRQVKHIEHSPVLRHGICVRKACEKRRNHVLFLFCKILPNHIPACPKPNHKRAGFHRLLKRAERI